MGTITAKDVNALRQQTGAGMMDCKNALVEADGDFEKAVEILRKKGQKVAANREDRDTKEGYVLATTSDDLKWAAIVLLNCETDFVAKNEDFTKMVETIAQLALKERPTSVDDLKKLTYNGDGLSVDEKLTEAMGKIGEKIDLSYSVVSSEQVYAYNHPGNRMASIIGLNKADSSLTEIAKDVAMQVAAMAPIAIDKDSIPQDVIDKELEIGKEQAIAEGKPADLAEKIAHGRLNKFYKESTLLNQEFIKDGKKTVAQVLKEQDSALEITGFQRVSLV